MARLFTTTAALLTLAACGSRECAVTGQPSCAAPLVCEAVEGKTTGVCYPPVTLVGKVFDLSTSTGVAGADVILTDEGGAPAGAQLKTGSDGTFTLRVPSTRSDEKGTFIARRVLLRAQAKNYLPFPSAVRIALPIDTAAATRSKDSDPFVLESAGTSVGLAPVSASAQNLPSITGKVEVAAAGESVFLALENATLGRTALSSSDGTFAFFNVPAGDFVISAFRRNQNYTPAPVNVASADVTGVTVKKSSTPAATLSGSVQLVAGANGNGTSVVLGIASTYIDTLGRADTVPGLRAPEPGTVPNITGNWSITGIPDGKYVVLAAFENDGNVRDPDPGISGTQLQRITVAGGAITQGSTSPQFKVTGAVDLVSPGKNGVEETTATPTFTWSSYSNADAYQLTVFDALGQQVWSKTVLDKATVSTVYAGPALKAGFTYQWRLTAIRRLAPTSTTEELRGLFIVK